MNELTYTSIYKLHNVRIASSRIDLSSKAWVESNPQYCGVPQYSDVLGKGFDSFVKDRLIMSFHESLIKSDVVIGTKFTDTEQENTPFDIEDCGFIAIAISIAFDSYFAAGLEIFSNSKQPASPPSFGPWTSLFLGDKSSSVEIATQDEARLRSIYKFVSNTFKSSTQNLSKLRLLNLYLRTIVWPPLDSLHVLKLGIPPFLNQETSIIANAALYYEHIFTRESERGKLHNDIQMWNSEFGNMLQVNASDVDIIFSYRDTFFHDNATRAKGKISKWQNSHHYSDRQAFEAIQRAAVQGVKGTMRVIVENYGAYQKYQSQLSQGS